MSDGAEKVHGCGGGGQTKVFQRAHLSRLDLFN